MFLARRCIDQIWRSPLFKLERTRYSLRLPVLGLLLCLVCLTRALCFKLIFQVRLPWYFENPWRISCFIRWPIRIESGSLHSRSSNTCVPAEGFPNGRCRDPHSPLWAARKDAGCSAVVSTTARRVVGPWSARIYRHRYAGAPKDPCISSKFKGDSTDEKSIQ